MVTSNKPGWKVDANVGNTQGPACKAPGSCCQTDKSTFCEFNYGIPKQAAASSMNQLFADLAKKKVFTQ